MPCAGAPSGPTIGPLSGSRASRSTSRVVSAKTSLVKLRQPGRQNAGRILRTAAIESPYRGSRPRGVHRRQRAAASPRGRGSAWRSAGPRSRRSPGRRSSGGRYPAPRAAPRCPPPCHSCGRSRGARRAMPRRPRPRAPHRWRPRPRDHDSEGRRTRCRAGRSGPGRARPSPRRKSLSAREAVSPGRRRPRPASPHAAPGRNCRSAPPAATAGRERSRCGRSGTESTAQTRFVAGAETRASPPRSAGTARARPAAMSNNAGRPQVTEQLSAALRRQSKADNLPARRCSKRSWSQTAARSPSA